MRNIIVFERIFEDEDGNEVTELDWRLQGQALPKHACPVAMVNRGKVMQWEAQTYDWNAVAELAARQAGLEGFWSNNSEGTHYHIVENKERK